MGEVEELKEMKKKMRAIRRYLEEVAVLLIV